LNIHFKQPFCTDQPKLQTVDKRRCPVEGTDDLRASPLGAPWPSDQVKVTDCLYAASRAT